MVSTGWGVSELFDQGHLRLCNKVMSAAIAAECLCRSRLEVRATDGGTQACDSEMHQSNGSAMLCLLSHHLHVGVDQCCRHSAVKRLQL